jgi:hypothetical protein
MKLSFKRLRQQVLPRGGVAGLGGGGWGDPNNVYTCK